MSDREKNELLLDVRTQEDRLYLHRVKLFAVTATYFKSVAGVVSGESSASSCAVQFGSLSENEQAQKKHLKLGQKV